MFSYHLKHTCTSVHQKALISTFLWLKNNPYDAQQSHTNSKGYLATKIIVLNAGFKDFSYTHTY